MNESNHNESQIEVNDSDQNRVSVIWLSAQTAMNEQCVRHRWIDQQT